MVMSKGRDGNCGWCVASKNIRAISRSHPRLKATERSEVTLEEYKGYISQSSPSESNRAQRGYP